MTSEAFSDTYITKNFNLNFVVFFTANLTRGPELADCELRPSCEVASLLDSITTFVWNRLIHHEMWFLPISTHPQNTWLCGQGRPGFQGPRRKRESTRSPEFPEKAKTPLILRKFSFWGPVFATFLQKKFPHYSHHRARGPQRVILCKSASWSWFSNHRDWMKNVIIWHWHVAI